MTFNSHGFIFMILPVTLIGFYLIKAIGVHKNHKVVGTILETWLIATSFWFLALFGIRNLIVLIVSLILNGILLFFIQKYHHKTLFSIGIVWNVVLLAVFKYNSGLAFPLAISYYTFSQISILVDTYRGAAGHGSDPMPPVSPLHYILYLIYYPKLLQGPITRYNDLAPQLDALPARPFDSEQFLRGAVLFCMGLGKKVLLADVYGGATSVAFADVSGLTSLDVIISMVAYSLQLYFDFSGYCDMGEGVSMMLGITLPVNFLSPFKSETPLAFWRRWHATLNDFLTDYVYIPLGGSRRGRVRTYLNIFLVFLVSGIWHGNVLTYVFWGFAHGIIAAINRAVDPQPAHGIRKGLRTAGVFVWWTVLISLFPSSSLGDWFTYLSRLGSTRINLLFVTKSMLDAMVPVELSYIMTVSPLVNTPWATIVPAWIMLLLGFVIVFALPNSHEIALKDKLTKFRLLLVAVLFVWSVTSLSGVSTFLYTNF